MRKSGVTQIPGAGFRGGMVMPVLAALCLAALLTSGCVGAAAQSRFKTEYLLDRDIVEVPFEYKEHQIIVKGEVDGHKDLVFLFDSGASAPVMDKTLGLHGLHVGDASIQEAEGVTAAEAIAIDDFRLGSESNEVRVENLNVLLTDLSQVSRLLGVHLDGIVGISFMAEYVIEIDYNKHLLR